MLSLRFYIFSFFTLFCSLASSQNDSIALINEVPPEFPGGEAAMLNFIYSNFNLPSASDADSLIGTVWVRFIIDENGYVLNPTIIKEADSLVGVELLRVVRMMPKWKPGIQNGKPVKVIFNLPFKYQLFETTQATNIYRPHKADSMDIAAGLYLTCGYIGLAGNFHDYLGNMALLGYGVQFDIKRLNLMAELEFGIGAKTKQEFDANGYWKKERGVVLFSTNLAAGYQLWSVKNWEFSPYSGLKVNTLGPSKQESTDPKDGFQLSQFAWPVGITAMHRYHFKDRGPMRSNATLLQLGFEYNYLKINDLLKGHLFLIKLKIGRDWMSKKRLQDALSVSKI
ncbi:MAG: energy transducer TonB [Saprospiraceae bacterium]|nr:energy transducer TonB [Saprospiraceae bacterium]